nr:GMC family oxidoreductase N-terminal domain-containing protein [Lachnospiraceae bacterium]
TRELFSVFERMGLDPQVTPKFLRKPVCANCGHCAIGCPTGIKWDTRELVAEAIEKGAVLISGCRVKKLLIAGNEVTGVVAQMGLKEVTYRADLVMLAAGGFGTPAILEASGIECEKTLFVDPVLCVAGVRKGFGQDRQLLMPFYSREDGYMLSPYLDYLSFFFDKRWRYPKEDIVSVMIKMADDGRGGVEGGRIHKKNTKADMERLRRGVRQCREILGRMGIPREETFLGILNAGHPGGMLPLTAETKESLHDGRLPANLYVADSTLFPESAGLPPILTIMALAMEAAARAEAFLG